MRAVANSLLIIALVSTHALAQEATHTNANSLRGIGCWADPAPLLTSEDLQGDAIEMTTGDADIEEDGNARFRGPVTMRSRDLLLQAGTASYDRSTDTFSASGGIEFRDGNSRIKADDVSYDRPKGTFRFSSGTFELPDTPARGSADAIEVSKDGYLELQNVRYTSCPAGNDDWLLKARSIEINANNGMGTARNATLQFKGVPFIYVPYFTYPVTDDRKSGLLFPSFGSSSRRGIEFEQPVYWNIRPDMDATIIPRYMSKRGLQLGAEYRFLTENTAGVLWGDFLSDKDADRDRWRYEVDTVSSLRWDWRSTIRVTSVSDDNYFSDLSGARADTSQTNLDRRLDLERYSSHWSMMLRLQDFQTIDDTIAPADKPYAQVPQFVANGIWNDGLLGLDYSLNTDTAFFYRGKEENSDGTPNGARMHLQPEIALPLEYRGLYLVPSVALDHTIYQLQDLPAEARDTPSRTAPITSVNMGAVFDRLAGKQNQTVITLEPRAQYTYIPYRNQDDIPVFDTITPDFNLVQLFRNNRFIGYDRLGDTNQLSAGVTSRVLDAGDGRELLALSVGQTRYFEDGRVTLPGETPDNFDASNYIAELDIRTWKYWSAGLDLQWDAENNEADRSSVRVQYRPDEDKVINVAYRYVRDSLEQTDFSFSWPLSKKWHAIGRYNYSILERQALDRFAGLEYETCCWAIRTIWQRSVTSNNGESDSVFGLQFEMKGFSNVGAGSISQMKRDIVGDWTR